MLGSVFGNLDFSRNNAVQLVVAIMAHSVHPIPGLSPTAGACYTLCTALGDVRCAA